ncbi:MAG: aldose 1-epimerase [Alteromonadaceae bacterium]|jgi:aldose 1-epimerase
MKVEASDFGVVDGENVTLYTLSNSQGMQAKILNYGGIIHELNVPDDQGKLHACVQSYSTIDGYVDDPSYRNAIVGRFANRIGHGTFTLEGTEYHLDKNGGEHNLHGGIPGFHKKMWKAKAETHADSVSLSLSLSSPDGEGGFPGNVNVKAIYTLDDANTLSLSLNATTDKATPFSLTQHAYFTLSKDKTVGSTFVQIDAKKVTDADNTLLPTGSLVEVTDTPFDFSELTRVNQNSVKSHDLYNLVGGYDHNFVLNESVAGKPQAQVFAEDTHLQMDLYTDLPGIQFYTGSLQTDSQLGALCLEPQHFPDAPNKPQFPDCIIYPDKPFTAEIRYQFKLI